jgi:hypothetical protein
MIDGMDILLERMKTYPEEFVESRKWHDIIGRVIDVLDEDELKTLEAAARQAQRDWFKGAVLKTLAGQNDPRISVDHESFYGGSLVEALTRHQRHKNEVVAKSYLAGASLTASVPTTLS